jgi:uncharacterized membrane protein YhaH (DUF805 family)
MASPQSQAVNPYAAPKAAVADAATNEVQPVKIFSVSGRIGRARYIANILGLYILFAILAGATAAVAGPIGAVFWIGYMVLVFMLTIQRCHDFDTSGWLSLLVLVPLVNLVFWFIPGSEGRNRWGAPTPPNSTVTLVLVWLFPALAAIGIVAAIALPAYQSYVKRAQQAEQLKAPSR